MTAADSYGIAAYTSSFGNAVYLQRARLTAVLMRAACA